MGALGHYIEDAGVATTQLSLVREHTAALAPPRALWVPFPLGRPLGVANDAAFQRRVLLAALSLLARETGPVLEDFPEDAPCTGEEEEPALACPVTFASKATATLAEKLRAEMAALEPWYAIAIKQRARTTVGLSGLMPAEAADYICRFADRDVDQPHREGLAPGLALRLACEDIKSYYLEACSAQPGKATHDALFKWFWTQTAAAEAFVRLREACTGHPDETVRTFGERNLIPRAAEELIRATADGR